MNSYLIYRASFYLMLTVATMTLSWDSGEARLGRLLPLVVAVAGVIAFFTVDRHPSWSLPRRLANGLALSSIVALYLEYRYDDTQMIRSLGHWLVYLLLIKYFMPKSAEDDWFLFLLGLVQVLIGAVIGQSDQVGTWLFLWAMLAVWVLGQFFLQREARRFSQSPGVPATPAAQAAVADPYEGLYNLPYAVVTTRVMITTLALGGLIFLVLPRHAGAVRSQGSAPMARHLTGFDEEVQLGQFGEILENDTVVMTVEFSDGERNPIQPDEDPLWRGVTMLQYDKGRWRRQTQRSPQMVVSPPGERVHPSRRVIRQKIKLEPNDSSTLFAMRPIRKWSSSYRVSPYLNPLDGTLFRPELRGGAYDYEVVSDRDPADPAALQLGESVPSFVRTELLLSMPEALKRQLAKIAEPIVAKVKGEGQEGTIARARALESYLRYSGLFHYSLHMEVSDSSLDPVEDFLVNRKQGHCEYFASALALLLRSVDIPSRMVNGFKGGDWNELTQTMNVRQKHAHSWVEAYAGLGLNNLPVWITLDPTPGAQRQESIAQVGGIAGSFRPLTDTIRHLWVFYIVGYDGERQERLVYTPLRDMAREVRRQYIILGRWLKNAFTFLFHFPDTGSFISIRGGVVSFILMSLVAGLASLGFSLVHRLRRWLRGPVEDSTSLTAGILFYRRLAQLLARFELERTAAETPGEFAVRANKFLTGQGPPTQSVAEVPQQVVDAFYRVRFGHLEIEPDSLDVLHERLDALEASLKHP